MADDRWACVFSEKTSSYETKSNVKNKCKRIKEFKDKELKVLYLNTRVNCLPPMHKEGILYQGEESPCNGNVIHNSLRQQQRRRTRYKVYKYNKQDLLDNINSSNKSRNVFKRCRLLDEQRSETEKSKLIVIGSDIIKQKSKHKLFNTKSNPFNTTFIVNVVSDYSVTKSERFGKTMAKAKVYRCQLGAVEESCCCSCNSDVMFEVMKSLYECYKRKNCDNCDCIICGHLPREERRLSELCKSAAALDTASVKERKKEIARRTQAALAAMEGKPPAEKEKILKELALSGVPLPEARTKSERAIMNKVRNQLGLPPEPKTAADKEKMKKAAAAGVLVPLEEKSPAEKERILTKQAELGIELPEGRTPSEKALVQKIKASMPLERKTPSEKMRRAKAAGLLTPIEGKTKEQKEKILKGLAMAGVPLPEGKTPSDKKILEKVRNEVGLPPEPKSEADKEKYKRAEAAGIMTPLEGKIPEQKDRILKAQHDMGLPLPEGRTASEKALIAKVKASPKMVPSGVVIPADKLRKARAAGFLTPLAGKAPVQKEKILRGQAEHGIPLPEGKTASEKKLIDKVRADLGLPLEPKTPAERAKYNKAAAAGLLIPLAGKTAPEKENLLKAQYDIGIPLPEGKSASEKAILAKINAKQRKPSEAIAIPSEKLKKAKAAGLLTPLAGKTPQQKEKILKGLATHGLPLPEAQTPSDKKLIDKVRAELGLPPEPKTAKGRENFNKAVAAGIIQPLEGKSGPEKEKILKAQHDMGIPLPEGRTPSEKALIAKVKAIPRDVPTGIPSEKIRKAKAAGLLTPLTGKTPQQKEKILKGLAEHGLPLPEGKTASEKKLIDKVRADLGLPPEPKTSAERHKYNKALAAGIIEPLEGKTPAQKANILKAQHDMGIPLPEGRTASEKALIANIRATPRGILSGIPSEKIRKAKAEGLLTPLAGKTPEQKEKILRGLATHGLPLPEGRTPSEKKLIDKVRTDLGLPPEPNTPAERDKYNKSVAAGIVQPLEGKSGPEKEKILKAQHDMGLPLPEGRTASEKALIAKVKAMPRAPLVASPSEKLRKAKAAGLMTPLTGKTPEQKEKILRGLAMHGVPLPKGKTASEKNLIKKVRADLGLPPEPKSTADRDKYNKALAAGIIEPLEGKSGPEKERILKAQHDMGLPLPEGRTPSEKALIAKVKATPRGIPSGVPSDKVRKARAAGLLTPLTGKTPEQKEKILRGLATHGLPLPQGQTASEKKLIDKVRADLGLPPEPKTVAERKKYDKAAAAGILEPLEGKSGPEKERLLKAQHDMGLPLPTGRTPSEKALIAKVKTMPRTPASGIPLEKLRKAKAAGFLTPLEGKTPEQKEKILRGLAMNGIPLTEGKTPSDKKLINKVRADLGLPPEPKTTAERDKLNKAAAAGILEPLEGKSGLEKERILKAQHNMGLPLPEARTPSEKALIGKIKTMPRDPSAMTIPSEKLRKARAAGFITPLEGKPPEQKEKILRGLAMHGIPLLKGTTASEKKLINKVRADLGLPPEPKTAAERDKYNKAFAAGIIEPLEGKSGPDKERILKAQYDLGLPLPEGRTPSEKALVAKVKATPRSIPSGVLSEKVKKARAVGLLTPLTGKTPKQKEKILRGLATHGLPLPEGRTASDQKLVNKIRADLGLPPEPKTAADRKNHNKAAAAGILEPLEGKSGPEKERILKAQHNMGLSLPEGRTPSEKALISKIKSMPRESSAVLIPSEKLRKARAAGLITPMKGKTPEQKAKILRGLAMHGIPLPDGKTASEKMLIDKVRKDLGLPPEPKTAAEREKYIKAVAAGIIEPLEGKSVPEKERILKAQHNLGLPIPEGRTPSEKALIAKVKAMPRARPATSLSEKLRKAKAAGLITPLTGKTPEQKEKIMRGLAMHGMPLPEGKTASEKNLIKKVKADLGLPPEPKTSAERYKYNKALAAGIIEPLEGKKGSAKEKILKAQHHLGVPLPDGRTPSEKALIAKVKATPSGVPSEKIRKARAAGLLTTLTGKSPEQKENILRGLATHGLPLPKGQTASEKKLIDKVRADLGLPPEPKTASERENYSKAAAAGILEPLVGKSGPEKERILKAQLDMGLPLPEGRTPSEKALIAKVKAMPRSTPVPTTSEKLRKAKSAGFLTPLEGKTPEQKEKILRGLAMHGIPLPEGKTPSEKKLVKKVIADLGLPPEPQTAAEREKFNKAAAAGILEPLEGKSGPEKEKMLKAQHNMGLPLPEGRTPSEKALIAKIKSMPREPSAVAIPSEKLRRAKAAGLITPLTGKTQAQKEKIIKGLAMEGLPLPEVKTISERKLIDKVIADLGLPPQPKTPSERQNYNKALTAGVIAPLLGKSGPEKEKILKAQHDIGIPLPEGRTPSEKALISKIKAMPRAPLVSPSEKIRKAKAAGFLTPLEGKTPEQKEKILRGLAKSGLPLPEGKTASEKKLIAKIRHETGLPPEPKTPLLREKYKKAHAAGIITPLEGKTPAQKENILRKMHQNGISLPNGRTASEKSMIRKIKAEPAISLQDIPSAKIRAAKAAGFLTPLKGKTSAQKENILRGMAKSGLPLPDGKTPSENELIRKVRKELGLPPESKSPSIRERLQKAQAAGIITLLEGKSTAQKEKILKRMAEAGIPLPEGRTASEKALIRRVDAESTLKPKKASYLGPPALPPDQARKLDQKTAKVIKEGQGPSDECICPLLTPVAERMSSRLAVSGRIPSEKIRQAKAAGLLTPLTGKTPARKDKIIRGLAKAGLPLPEGKTPSEKSMIRKIKGELGIPPEARTASENEIIKLAKAEGLLTPLTGKSLEQKKKIVRGLAAAGLPIPEGTTPSEKDLVKKLRTEMGLPTEATQSEKGRDFRTRRKPEFGVAPEAFTPSEKALVKKAKADGLITPLKGKTTAQKEKIIRGLAQAGLPVPEGTTLSEKDLVKKIRTELGMPPEPTPSEKRGRIRTKSKKKGEKVPGMSEEFEDIIKTTTCDRGCGCDKKKIRFKHSYVKIRVTSPDISSLCPCPEECLPRVKGGVFVDSEGIKVTVERAIGFPSFPIDSSHSNKRYAPLTYAYEKRFSPVNQTKKDIHKNKRSTHTQAKPKPRHCGRSNDDIEYLLKRNAKFATTSDDDMSMLSEHDTDSIHKSIAYGDWFTGIHRLETHATYNYPNISCSEHYVRRNCSRSQSHGTEGSARSSFESFFILKTGSSLSLATGSLLAEDTVSIISLVDSTFSSDTNHYLIREQDTFSVLNINGSCFITNSLDYDTSETLKSYSRFNFSQTKCMNIRRQSQMNKSEKCEEVIILRFSHTDVAKDGKYSSGKPYKIDSMVVIQDSESDSTDNSFVDLVNELLLQNKYSEDSSLYVLVSTSDEYLNSESSLGRAESTMCIQTSKHISKWDRNATFANDGIKFRSKGKRRRFMEAIGKLIDEKEALRQSAENQTNITLARSEHQMKETITLKPVKKFVTVSVDTMRDRPCCCTPIEQCAKDEDSDQECIPTVASKMTSPIIAQQGAAQGLQRGVYRSLPQRSSKSLTSSQHTKILTYQHSNQNRVPQNDTASYHSWTAKLQTDQQAIMPPPITLPPHSLNQLIRIGSHQPVNRMSCIPPLMVENAGPYFHIGIQTPGSPKHHTHPRSAVQQLLVDSKPKTCHISPCRRLDKRTCTQMSVIAHEEGSPDNCKCGPGKLKGLFERVAREMNSVSCGHGGSKTSIRESSKPSLPYSKVAAKETEVEEGSTCLPAPKRGTCSCDKRDPKRKKTKQYPYHRVAPLESKGCQ